MLHQLDLSEDTNQDEITPQAVVDDERLVTNNQPVTTKPMAKSSMKLTLILSVLAIVAGIGTGYGSHKLYAGTSDSATVAVNQQHATDSVKEGDIFGSTDAETFSNNAKGYLEKGGIEGEGSHHLLRPGGASQTLYMTSSVTDLDKFEGMEVEVWGETFTSEKAGWFMDVGRVQIVAIAGQAPVEE